MQRLMRLVSTLPPKRGLIAEYRFEQQIENDQTLWNNRRVFMNAQNVVVNGNFADETWINAWSTLFAVVNSIGDGIISFTATAANGSFLQLATHSVPGAAVVGHKYFFAADVKAASNLVALSFGGTNVFHSGGGNFERLRGIFTATATDNGVAIKDTRTSGWNMIQAKNIHGYDLTAMFGVGNEPNIAQCEEIFREWRDGIVSLPIPNLNGQLGSSAGVDTSDPTWTGQGLQFTTDDYTKGSIIFDATKDFSIFIALNVLGPSGAVENFCSISHNYYSNQKLSMYKSASGALGWSVTNDAGVLDTNVNGTTNHAYIPVEQVTQGYRLLVAKFANGIGFFKDISSGVISQLIILPAAPITLNQLTFGCRFSGASTAQYFFNSSIHWAMVYQCATSDADNKRILNYMKRQLAQRGVVLAA
ncbi:MAG: hypothetical protein HPY66_1660 [Firmicutes bacterium]|nr:hypothetical protein [Bacillota bacterium]